MLKPYNKRVMSTYFLEKEVLTITNRDADIIRKNKLAADEVIKNQMSFPLEWNLDEKNFDWISFKGFSAKYKKSEVSDSMRLWYDRNEPYDRKIKFFNNYLPSVTVEKPFAYIVPQGWENVINRLDWNGVLMKRLTEDISLNVNVYYVDSFSTWSLPDKSTHVAYEGHYIHYNVSVRKETQQLKFYKGDYVVFTNQTSNRYIVEMLEPQGTDSYFAWNFFDPVLMEKEYFSDYVFEDVATDLLRKDSKLKNDLELKKKSDPEFAKDKNAQLYFIYSRSPYFETSYRRYPVGRVESNINLPVN
jgi:hypothetical protein